MGVGVYLGSDCRIMFLSPINNRTLVLRYCCHSRTEKFYKTFTSLNFLHSTMLVWHFDLSTFVVFFLCFSFHYNIWNIFYWRTNSSQCLSLVNVQYSPHQRFWCWSVVCDINLFFGSFQKIVKHLLSNF